MKLAFNVILRGDCYNLVMRSITYVKPYQWLRDFVSPLLAKRIGVKSRLACIMFVGSYILLAINNLKMGFHGVNYLSFDLLYIAPIFLVMYVIAVYLEAQSPLEPKRWPLVLKAICYFVGIALLFELASTAVQYTPFPLIDHYLLRFDQLLGFSTTALLNWTMHHSWFYWLSICAYVGLSLEMIFAPLLLALLKDKRGMESFFIYALLSSIITFVIYYFLPSTDPSHVIHNQYFTADQRDTYIKYYEMIHHMPITTASGGLISFPSLHVIWSIMVTYPFRHRKKLFYPLLIFNSCVILSTLSTGWHFLADVFGSFLVGSICIYFAEKWSSKNWKMSL